MTLPYTPRVYDVRPSDHSSLGILPRLGEDDFGPLQAFYKFQLDFSYGYDRAGPGEKWWAIAGFELKAGPAILQPQVWDEDGNLITDVGILLFLGWPGADPLHPDADPRYTEKAIGGFTDGGSLGWGVGGESQIGDEGGPFIVWASSDPSDWTDRRVGSDAVRRLGWWDEHIIPNPIFQVVRKGGTAPASGEYLVQIRNGVIVGHIPFIPGAPGTSTEALGLWRDGAIVEYVPWVTGAPVGG